MNPTPIKYKLSDLRKIVAAKHQWESAEGKRLIKDLRKLLEKAFDKKCYYCQTRINIGNVSPEIDHILYKDKYKYFTFRPENLVWSCKICNTNKGTKDALITSNSLHSQNYLFKDYKSFNANNFKIIHAYFDNYDDHIDFLDKIFPVPKNASTKGTKTIEICKLYRLSLIEDKVNESINKKNAIVEAFKSENYDELIEKYQKKLEQDQIVYDVLKYQEVKDIADGIVEYDSDNIKINCNYFVNYYFQYKQIIESFLVLKGYLNTKNTISDAFNIYKVNLGISMTSIEDLFEKNILHSFKCAYESGQVSFNINSRIKDKLFTCIDELYSTSNNIKRLRFLLLNKDKVKTILKLTNKKLIKDNLDGLDTTVLSKIENTIEIYKKYEDVSKYFYSVGLIPSLYKCYELIEADKDLYIKLKSL